MVVKLQKILVLLITMSIVLCSGKFYKPEDLINLSPYNDEINLYDPNNYLNSNLINEMTQITNNVKKEKNYEVFVYIISSINNNYGYDKDKDIDWFTNDLTYLKLKSDSEKDENSIFIVIAIEDRQSHLRTGRIVKSYLQDSKCSEYLDSINSNLKNGEYNLALFNLLKKIESRLMTKYQWLSDLGDWLYNLFIKILIIIGLAIFCLVLTILTEKKLSKSAEDQLKKIKKITENGKPRRELIEKVCVICLEELEENIQQDQKQTNLNNELNSEVPELEISKEERQFKEKDNLLDKKEDHFIAKLECGHSFHSKCISEWMVKNNKCPICREKIDKEDEPPRDEKTQNQTNNLNTTSNRNAISGIEVLTRSLINIQTSIHPELSSLDFTYGSSFSWRMPTSNSSSRSSYSFKWGSGSGGGCSKW
jgi:hypothetical protein